MEKINTEVALQGQLGFDEALAAHTTFRLGGPADVWVRPEPSCFAAYSAALLRQARQEGVPVFVLGGGANIVAADRGIRGIVLDATAWTGCAFDGHRVEVRAGTEPDAAAEACAVRSLGGLAFLAGMPGTLGGAVWMNARCYGSAVADVLAETRILDEAFRPETVPFRPADFDYKKSPFQDRRVLILSAVFTLTHRPEADLRAEMEAHRADRREKGHYRLPSAGSAFKNNHAFGQPTGKIIDELGLRGLQVGGARVADWHGNIIVNTGGATAADVRRLADEVARRVRAERGLQLECEILFVGDWAENDAAIGYT